MTVMVVVAAAAAATTMMIFEILNFVLHVGSTESLTATDRHGAVWVLSSFDQ
jgi:hypothetical protein